MAISGIGGGWRMNTPGSSRWGAPTPADQGVAPAWRAPDWNSDVAVARNLLQTLVRTLGKRADALAAGLMKQAGVNAEFLSIPGRSSSAYGPEKVDAVRKATADALRALAKDMSAEAGRGGVNDLPALVAQRFTQHLSTALETSRKLGTIQLQEWESLFRARDRGASSPTMRALQDLQGEKLSWDRSLQTSTVSKLTDQLLLLLQRWQ